jgi:hypothetical protein
MLASRAPLAGQLRHTRLQRGAAQRCVHGAAMPPRAAAGGAPDELTIRRPDDWRVRRCTRAHARRARMPCLTPDLSAVRPCSPPRPPRHLHLRDGDSLTSVVPFTARVFGRAVVMPNLKPPVRTLADAAAYRARVLAAVPPGVAFEPLMTLYLTGALRVRRAWWARLVRRAWCATLRLTRERLR